MLGKAFRTVLISAVALTASACSSEPKSEPKQSPAEIASRDALHDMELKAPAPFFCLLRLNELGDDLDKTQFKPAKAYVDFYRSKLVDILEDDPREIWMPHWKSISLSKSNIDAQVEAYSEEYSALNGHNRNARARLLVSACVQPALLAGVGPRDEIAKARARKAADEEDYRKVAEANSAK